MEDLLERERAAAAAEPRNQWLPAQIKAEAFYGCFNSGLG
jgi:hypothetical protein